ncbi:flavodoxin [Enterococcus sp. 669A]|uniref:Flavodoxin n=1 Tax=Candidatus Enterococcus moelleringii TaxID=2815325 RepID=A0ABS3LCG1_9ENTE|nr:flavodoxin [Enterococcus sp. 669A]MBO1307322.1 flavodoxin [Enterococcus sp. 669A]
MAEIILYFSRSGINYVNGSLQNLAVGNTKVVAEMIHQITAAQLFEIRPLVDYPLDYSECLMRTKQEQRKELLPELLSYPKEIDSFETIYLGFPIFWQTYPKIVQTLLLKMDFSNKIIKPFCTHEGDGFANSLQDLAKVCESATLKEGIAIPGGRVKEAFSDINQWVGL